ncbi:hypothetical protein B296_00024509 [Ensete ventricosum]|uniref:Uncharacterized protein n=1 Tax=Ensete ventricosum TaxID=4639 RepID=A0A427ACR6_ENSVE|nr:hypothetical protein B296_00024509 [Ensete ventricosum]
MVALVCWQSPLRPAPLPLLAVAPCRLAAPAGTALQVAMPVGDYRPCGLVVAGCRSPIAPLQGALAIIGCPLASGQAVANHPYRWLSHGRLSPFLTAFASKIQQERRVHYKIGQLWLFFRIFFFFMFKALFWMFNDLFFHGFNHKKSPFFTVMLAALRLIAIPT